MRLQVENTLGIIHAEVDIEPGQIVEVVGPNASGKTSLAVCAQAVFGARCQPARLVGGGRQAQLPARRRGRCAGDAT